MIIPIEDMLWASQQKSSVTQLWQECWTSDPYGSRWMPLSTGMGYSTFISAKKILSESGLFIFKPDKSIQDGRETVGWMIRNLHGSRMKEFWEGIDSAAQEPDSQKQAPNSEKRELNAGDLEIDAGSEEMGALYQARISGESQSEKRFQQTSRTAQKHLTNSSKEIVRCFSDTQNADLLLEETAIAPFRGASPPVSQSVSEIEVDLPVATDCTTLTLVNAVQSQPASLRDAARTLSSENSFFGNKVRDLQEDTIPAAPVAQNEKCSTKSESQAQQSQLTSLIAEKSVPSEKPRTDCEGTYSAAPIAQDNKWSSEALFTAEGITARSKMRPQRIEKLKLTGMLGEKPAKEFLAECWNDDPALQIVIKKLLAKFPQWGIACVDGALVDWDAKVK